MVPRQCPVLAPLNPASTFNLRSATFQFPREHLTELAAGLHGETRLVYAVLPTGIVLWTVTDRGVSATGCQSRSRTSMSGCRFRRPARVRP